MDQERKEQVARNEAAARERNERFGIRRFTCECGSADCHAVIRVPLDIYRSVRKDDMRFIIKPGHEIPGTEDVVIERDEWAVVRKRDDVAHIVRRAR